MQQTRKKRVVNSQIENRNELESMKLRRDTDARAGLPQVGTNAF